MSLWEEIAEHEAALAWEGTFAEYYELVRERPQIARLAHARIYDAIRHAGTRLNRLGQTTYNLFADELFGLERTLQQLESYFASAAQGLETRRRILLLVGPPGSGKSTLVNLLKRGLEQFSRTEEGALYAIAGCPIQEEPLHLIPPEFRAQAEQELGVAIEGDLCPYCRWLVRETYRGEIQKVKVRRVLLSEAAGIGIGTFVATDPRSQDMSRLIGSIDYNLLGDDRLNPSGKAFRLDGELDVANRGLVEFVEIFKLEERFLAMLLVLSEEHKIKAPGFGTVYVDEAIIAHTNEAEYRRVIDDPRSEALQDRIVVLQVPYNLRVSDEVRIYEKLLQVSKGDGIQASPLALRVAATLAVLSRLEPPRTWGPDLLLKMRLYDGEYERGYDQEQVEEWMEAAPREGMEGISPRFIANQIAQAFSRAEECLDPVDLLQTLWEGVEQSTTLSQMDGEQRQQLFRLTRLEYDRLAVEAVQKAMVPDFHGKAEALWKGYVANVQAYFTGESVLDPSTGKRLPADEEAMRRLERLVDLEGNKAIDYRREVLERYQTRRSQGLDPDYTSEPRLAKAIERHLLTSRREVARLVGPVERLDSERLKERADVLKRLQEEHGFPARCAERLLEYVAEVTGARRRARWPKALRWLAE